MIEDDVLQSATKHLAREKHYQCRDRLLVNVISEGSAPLETPMLSVTHTQTNTHTDSHTHTPHHTTHTIHTTHTNVESNTHTRHTHTSHTHTHNSHTCPHTYIKHTTLTTTGCPQGSHSIPPPVSMTTAAMWELPQWETREPRPSTPPESRPPHPPQTLWTGPGRSRGPQTKPPLW